MHFDVIPVPESQKSVLDNLLELYLYDLNEITPNQILFELNAKGRFAYPNLPIYWQDPSRKAYIVWQNDCPIGCVLVHQDPFYKKDTPVFVMSEFFILKMYRRQGIGVAVASYVMHQNPGNWEIRVIQAHQNGYHFWTKVVENVAPGCYEVLQKQDDEWYGHVFCASVADSLAKKFK